MGNLTLEEIKELRPDLVEANATGIINSIEEGVVSPYHVANFVYLLNSGNEMSEFRRGNYPDVSKLVDKVVAEENFDLSEYKDRKYNSTPEAHERAFKIYLKVYDRFHKQFDNLSYSKLMFG